ncbi:MAG: glycolate oxidase subunit GlcF [Gammaproteobacteria bacterium]
MQTNLPQELLSTPTGKRADEILRKCVHCGFCNATCPTHQITGDELDGPRGRIYLIKEMLEGNETTKSTLDHLDNCLTCLNCETTCPSGVNYGELVEIGRETIDTKKLRSLSSTFKRWMICNIFPYPARFRPFYLLAKLIGAAPLTKTSLENINLKHKRSNKVILLDGCVQSITSPEINHALSKILISLNIQPVSLTSVSCCGAIQHHNGQAGRALDVIKANIDNWWPEVESGCEAIIMSASGCGSMVKDYYRLLKNDHEYSHKAMVISNLTKDASEFLSKQNFSAKLSTQPTIAFHPPCTLQHNQKVVNVVESILHHAGYQLTEFKDKHLCCGSAGTYSILQPELASQLRSNKISAIEMSQPDIIATANIGCILHLQKASSVPVIHWLDLVEVTD